MIRRQRYVCGVVAHSLCPQEKCIGLALILGNSGDGEGTTDISGADSGRVVLRRRWSSVIERRKQRRQAVELPVEILAVDGVNVGWIATRRHAFSST
jgi:hypothetical protein